MKKLTLPLPSAETLAREFHDAYERLAPSFGYTTNDASRKPWPDVPERNRLLMQAVALYVLDYITKYVSAGLNDGDVLHRDTIPFHAISDVVDHYRAGLPTHDVADRLHITLMWLWEQGHRAPALPYPPIARLCGPILPQEPQP